MAENAWHVVVIQPPKVLMSDIGVERCAWYFLSDERREVIRVPFDGDFY